MTTAEFNDCVKEYADGMYRFALKSSGNEEDARDIVQHAFTVLWENRESVDITKAKSYLFTLVYRKSVDRFRTAGRQKLMDVLPEKGSEVIFQAGLKKSIEKALMNLSGLVALELDANWENKKEATDNAIKKTFKDFVPYTKDEN